MSADQPDHKPRYGSLGESARAAVLWGAGFTLVRDVLQFATMLVLVRLLSQQDYGRMALAQSVISLLSIVGFGTLAAHVLQVRDPKDIDWQSHFTAACAINSALFVIALSIAYVLSRTERFAAAALPLAVASIVFLIEIPATLRHYMAQAEHDWGTFRFLLLAGALLGSAAGVVVAASGGGVWALAVQPVMTGLPAAANLLLVRRWRPDWSWSARRYRDAASFGVVRMASAGLNGTRQMTEHATLAANSDFAALGVFTRSMGLASLIAGRIGTVSTSALYPVITRSEAASPQFRQHCRLVLQGTVWLTVPAAALLGLVATDVVGLLYGPNWASVAPLLPFACASVAATGVTAAAYYLLLANDQPRSCFLIDVVSATLGIALIVWLLPYGMHNYLMGLTGHGAVILALTLAVLIATRGIALVAVVYALVPAIVAAFAALASTWMLQNTRQGINMSVIRLLIDTIAFSCVYALILRLVFPTATRELLAVVPGGQRLQAILYRSRHVQL